MSQRKLLWTDETFTQIQTIDSCTYKDIFTLKFPEGNRNPLFYIIQKITCDLSSFQLNSVPKNITTPNRSRDAKGQVILRIPSNLFISLGLALIFYFFAKYYSLWTALYALAVSFASPMIWMFWVEARPYSLWFLLTTIQLVIAWGTVIEEKESMAKRRGLATIHLLLALTSVASIFQILIITFLLWCRKYYRKSLLWTVAIPTGFALIYYFLVPMLNVRTDYFWINLTDAIMPERICIYILFGLIYWKSPKNTFFTQTFLLFLATACYLLYSHMNTKPPTFGFYNRYLMFLVPLDIMLMSIASHELVRSSRKHWGIFINTLILLAGLLLIRALLTYRAILASGLYLHSPG